MFLKLDKSICNHTFDLQAQPTLKACEASKGLLSIVNVGLYYSVDLPLSSLIMGTCP